VKWRFTAGTRSTPRDHRSGRHSYVGTGTQQVYAIADNAARFRRAMELHHRRCSGSSPTLGFDGTVYIASDDFNVYALTDNGQLPDVKWSYATGGRPSPARRLEQAGSSMSAAMTRSCMRCRTMGRSSRP